MSSTIDKFRSDANVEQISRGSSSSTSHEQSLVVKNRHKETRKKHCHKVSSTDGCDDSDDNDTPTCKSPRVSSHHSCVQSLTVPAHRDNDKVSLTGEKKMNSNSKAFQ